MDPKKKKRLEADGWRVGAVEEFLGLSAAEMEIIDMHIRLSLDLTRRLEVAGLSQSQLAKKLGIPPPRLSSMLAGKQVSTDALVRALLVLGASRKDIGRVIGSGTRKSKAPSRAA